MYVLQTKESETTSTKNKQGIPNNTLFRFWILTSEISICTLNVLLYKSQVITETVKSCQIALIDSKYMATSWLLT